MKKKIILALAVPVLVLVNTAATMAGDAADTAQSKTIIVVKTDDFEMAETDISDLQVGESETIVTDSGKTIDLLRTEDGVEIFVDGELLEMEFGDEHGVHGEHQALHKRIEVICEDEDDCEEMVWISDGGDFDFGDLHGEDGEHKVIRRAIRVECDSDDDCSKHKVLINGGDFDIEALHEHGNTDSFVTIHKGEGDHAVEIISDEDVDIESLEHGQKVIVIKKKIHKD